MAEEKNNSYKFRGVVVGIQDTKTGVSVSGEWMKQVVLVKESEFNKIYPFEIFGKEKCEKWDLKEGDEVIFSFGLHSANYKGKYFNTARVFGCKKFLKEEKKEMPDKPIPNSVQDNPKPERVVNPMNINDLPF